MKTDALIAMLAAGPVRADRSTTARRIGMATAAGGAVALVAMLLFLPPRPDLSAAALTPMFWLKLALPLIAGVAAFAATTRLARPGGSARIPASVLAALVASLWLLAAIVVAATPTGGRRIEVVGATALPCVASIVALALPLLVAAFVALRSLAPTQPRAAGLAAGTLAGAVAAFVYAVHCTETTVPFFAVWYVLGIAASAALGAALGPRWLRWR
ncbi:MAG: DUF1109 domain-containing protein [Caldimonas sp.]